MLALINKAVNTLHKIEDALLVFILGAMVVLATTQILLRNLFDTGIAWIDPSLHVLVLWIGLLGALVASRQKKHIAIDVLSNFLPKRIKLFSQSLTSLFVAVVCGLIAYHAIGFVFEEYQYATTAFSGIPAWLLQSIIPFTFTLITIRYALFSIQQCYMGLYHKVEES